MTVTNTQVQIIDKKQGLRMLDEEARRYLGISGEEFIRRWDAGEYTGQADRPDVMGLVMLLPFAR